MKKGFRLQAKYEKDSPVVTVHVHDRDADLKEMHKAWLTFLTAAGYDPTSFYAPIGIDQYEV
jgi:hypothetical protein